MSKHQVGRRTKYKPDYHPQKARELAEQGLIDRQIAEQFGINPDTLYEWKNKYPEFSDAIEQGKEPRLVEIEEAAYIAAMGQYVEEITTVYAKDGNITEKRIVRKYIPQNARILIFLMTNLFGDKYKNKAEITIDPIKKEIQDMTPEEREAEIERLMKQRNESND